MRIYINECEFRRLGIIIDENFSEVSINYIQDNYFNGAESAVIFIGGYEDRDGYMEYEFELMPG